MLVQWHLAELNTNTGLQPLTAPCTALGVIEATENCSEITAILQQTRTDDSDPDPTVLDNTALLSSGTFCAHVACLVCRGFSGSYLTLNEQITRLKSQEPLPELGHK